MSTQSEQPKKRKGVSGLAIDAAGIFHFVHPSQTATDRPAVDDLFAVLHQINGHRN